VILAEMAHLTAADGHNVSVQGPPVMLKPQAALFLSLVVHELATNAAKYGALSAAGGRVEIAWTIAGDRPPRLDLSWSEQGGPKIDGLPRRGFGAELIEHGIRFELQGEATLEAVAGALHCTISIPGNPQYITFGVAPDTSRREEAAS
jgi:two-component system, chemotaxis family, CheB/CheR fusion protein